MYKTKNLYNIQSDVITFPEIRAIKGKHRLSWQEIADAAGIKTYKTLINKINKLDFDMLQMMSITKHFARLEKKEATFEYLKFLFFDWLYSIE